MNTSSNPVASHLIAFSSLLSGALASGAVALLFLLVDGFRGNPTFTPSLLGSVVLLGEAPTAAAGIRLDMVALYSLVHFFAFAAIGTASSLIYLRLEPLRRRPELLGGLIAASLSLGFLTADVLLFPGLGAAIGTGWVIVANVVGGGVMTSLIHSTLASAAEPALSGATARHPRG